MKALKSLLVLGTLLLSTTAQANDYALLETYPLFNDMNMVKKEKKALNSMEEMILQGNASEALLEKKSTQLSLLMKGLQKGDSQLGLKGTNIKSICKQIKQIESLWSNSEALFKAALKNDIYQDQAYLKISELQQAFNRLHALYTQSYARYKKNTVMKSLVSSYMHAYLHPKQRYALNTLP